MKNFKYLTTNINEKKHLWVSLQVQNNDSDLPNTSFNDTLLNELSRLFHTAEEETTSLEGLVIYSEQPHEASKNTEINELSHFQQREQIIEFITVKQATFQALANLKIPSLVIINGLPPFVRNELMLAADYCIASNSPAVKLRFPEVSLGIHPSFSVVQHAIQRMGVVLAMSHLLTGRELPMKAALETKLIDACVSEKDLNKTVSALLSKQPDKKRPPVNRLLNTPPFRWLTAQKLAKTTERRQLMRQRYPAPNALLNLWVKFGSQNTEQAQQAYAESLAYLSQTCQSISLTRLAKLKARLHGFKETPPAYAANHIHLIGSNMTTCDIATYLLLQRKHITLQDKRAEAITYALNKIRENLTEHLGKSEEQANQLIENITADTKGVGVEQADLVMVVEAYHLADSQEAFADIEERAKPDAILATHSAIVPLSKISAALLKPQRLIGIHFGYPAFQTELTEISYTKDTDPQVIKNTARLIRSFNKTPLLLKNSPGLLVDRVLTQYILQGIRLYQQGVPHTIIDKSARDAGMPYGPLELADRMGLDYCLRVSEVFEKAFNIEIPFSLIEMVRTGKLGIKSGSGYYRYRNGNRLKPARVEWEGSEQALQEKLIGQITEEASICLEEGLVEDPDLIDAGIVFGTGFAPFTGGPLYHQRTRETQNKRARS